MAGLANAGKHVMLDAFGASATFLSLHSADPGASGTTAELSGGSPAYARKGLAWNAAATGAKTNSAPVVFDVPAAQTVTHVGYWSAVTGGTYYGSRALGATESFTGQGTYTVPAGQLSETLT